MNVLVIQHERLAREILKDERWPLPFVTGIMNAATEAESEEILCSVPHDVVFLDMQLPDSGAFRIAGRVWTSRIPAVVCTTAFDRPLLEALRRHRVEHLVRPFGSDELAYVLNRAGRPDLIGPADNLRRLLDAAVSLNQSVRGRLSVSKNGVKAVVEIDDVVALRRNRDQICLWTSKGIFETVRPLDELWAYAGFSVFRRLYRNAFLRTGGGRPPEELRRAKRWLRRCALADFVLNRPAL